MLEVDGLACAYGRHRALLDVSLPVREGESVVILGANGAGKTTLLNAIAGLIEPSAGSVRLRGEELKGLQPHETVGKGISTVAEPRHLFGPMSVIDNLRLGAFTPAGRGAVSGTLDRVFALFPRLDERRSQIVRTLSGGEQQMVAVGRALMARPSLLLLDEPSLGLAPLVAEELFVALERIRRDGGVSILMVEQNAHRGLKMADRAYLLALGRIVSEGAAKAFAEDKAEAESYLGF